MRDDVILRIATLDGIQPSALKDLNDVLTKLLSGSSNMKKSPMGGVRAAAEIMNFLSGSIEGAVIEKIREYDGDLAQKILDEMFVFDNLIDIDDRGIQLVLREVQSESLIVALKGASEELREKILRNMSGRAALGVDAGGIARSVAVDARHGLGDLGVDGCGGGMVEIDASHGPKV